MNINIYNPYVRAELYHHGILGQKWGKKNGPPYPLGANDHSASEKKAGWRKSLDKNQAKAEKRIKKYHNMHWTKQRPIERKLLKAHKTLRQAQGEANDALNTDIANWEKKHGREWDGDAGEFWEKMMKNKSSETYKKQKAYDDMLDKYIGEASFKNPADEIYRKAFDKNKNLSVSDKKKLYNVYISRMTDEEINQIANWAIEHDKAQKAVNDSWTAYEKEFNKDPKRRKLVENWSGDGTELYRKMQSIMPNKKDQELNDKELKLYTDGEELAKKIAKRITEDDGRFIRPSEWKDNKKSEKIDSDVESYLAVRDAGWNVKEILSYGTNANPKKIAKQLGLSESYVRQVLASN